MGEIYKGFRYYAGSSEQQMPKALPKLQTIDKDSTFENVNEVVELYNILLCFREFEELASVPECDKSIYRTPCQIIPKICGRFCSTINDDNITACFQQISVFYIDSFISLLEYHQVFARISESVFVEIIAQKYVSLERILSRKSIVTRYDAALAQYMQSNVHAAEVVISQLWGTTSESKALPKSLSNEQINQIVDSYIDQDDDKIHPTFLELVENAFDTNGVCVADEIKLKAKKRRVLYWKTQTSDMHLFRYGYEIAYTTDLPASDPVNIEWVDNELRYTYSQNWFDENLDYPTILNNFIWLFGFVDLQYRCTFPPSISKISLAESLFGIHGQRYYPAGIQCGLEQRIAHTNLAMYYQKLLHAKIRLEDVFAWFFCEYALSEFDIDNYHFEAPSEHTSLLEKCKLMALAIDEILKQFSLWVKHDSINRELLQISSKPLEFGAVGSKQLHKYAYAKSDNLKREMGLLFSNTFPISKCDDARTFADLLQRQEVQESDFEDWEKENLDFLVSRGSVQYDGSMLSCHRQRITLLKDLYAKEVICPLHLPQYEQLLSQLDANDDIEYECTLFTRPEQRFLNQKLNKAKFVNGDDLRNKYVHGCYPLEKEKQEHDYYDFLVVISLIIIKINEEFLLADNQKSKED